MIATRAVAVTRHAAHPHKARMDMSVGFPPPQTRRARHHTRRETHPEMAVSLVVSRLGRALMKPPGEEGGGVQGELPCLA